MLDNFLTELHLQRAMAIARLSDARGRDDVLAEAMRQRLDDLDRIAARHAIATYEG